MTGGLVQEFEHAYLPPIRPVHTFLVTAAFMMVEFSMLSNCESLKKTLFVTVSP